MGVWRDAITKVAIYHYCTVHVILRHVDAARWHVSAVKSRDHCCRSLFSSHL